MRYVGFGINWMMDCLKNAQERMPDVPLGIPRFSLHMSPPGGELPEDMRGLMVVLHLDVADDVATEILRLSLPE
jgi:hypothetical protein